MILPEDTKTLTRRALAGESFTVDREPYSLHELTQVAVALRPDAAMAIRGASALTPIERASIESVSPGRVVFL